VNSEGEAMPCNAPVLLPDRDVSPSLEQKLDGLEFPAEHCFHWDTVQSEGERWGRLGRGMLTLMLSHTWSSSSDTNSLHLYFKKPLPTPTCHCRPDETAAEDGAAAADESPQNKGRWAKRSQHGVRKRREGAKT
jgi:hypothetical protein